MLCLYLGDGYFPCFTLATVKFRMCLGSQREIGTWKWTWKRYLQHQLKTVGGLFFLNCNYDVKDYTFTSQFYLELLLWWSQFRDSFATDINWTNIIWNNKEIRIDKKPIF